MKSADVIERMRAAGAIARDVLVETGAAVAPGVTTDEIDRIAHEAHIARDVYPSPLGYRRLPEVGVHVGQRGDLPRDPRRPRAVEGDIVNIDVTVYVDGVHGDTNATFAVGRIDPVSERLVAVTERVPRPRASKRCARVRRCTTSGARSRRTPTPRVSTSCRRSSVTASARCSTVRRRYPTTTSRTPARSWSPGWSSPSSP